MKRVIANGDGGETFFVGGGLAAVTAVIQGALNLGSTAIQTNAYVKVNESNNESLVKIHNSDNSARVKIAEIWSQHSREIVTGILMVFVIIALLIYLYKSPRH